MSFALYLLYLVASYLRPIELLAPGLADYRPMLWLWAFAFVSALVSAYLRQQVAARRVYFGLMTLLVVIIALSSLLANMWLSGALQAISDFSASAMLFVLTCLNLTTMRRVRITCTTFVLCLVTISLLTTAAYHYGVLADQLVLRQSTSVEDALNVAPSFNTPSEDVSGESLWRVRYLGFLSDPNDLGQAIIVCLPLLWVAHQRRRALHNLLLVGLPGAALLYTLYLTHSRGALLGLAAIFLFGLRRLFGTPFTIVLSLALAVGASTFDFTGGRGFSTEEESAGSRIDAWNDGLQMLKSHPVLGVGFGNFTEYHVERTAHNSFVLCFSELGLAGFFTWVALLVVTFRDLAQAVRESPPESAEHRMAAMLRSSLIGFIVCAWFLSRTYEPGLYLLLALCASAAYCARLAYAQGEAAAVWMPRPWAGATLVAMTASIGAVYGFMVMDHLFNP